MKIKILFIAIFLNSFFFIHATNKGLPNFNSNRIENNNIVTPPTITPIFDPIGPICSGTTPPTLPSASTNGVVGSWSPTVIDNMVTTTYIFTPFAGQNADVVAMTITVVSAPVINTPTPLEMCDDDNDGVACFDLHSKDAEITGGNPNLITTYHESLTDAQIGTLPLASPYCNLNSLNTQTLYVRVVDPLAPACYSITTLQLIVHPKPIIFTPLPDLTNCDTDSNNQDGISVFDLTQNKLALLALQSGVASNYTVTFHEVQSDALTGTNPIINPNAYQNTTAFNQIIRVSIVNNTTYCRNVTSFHIIVIAPLGLTPPAALSKCDDDSQPNNLYTTFDLTVKDAEITNNLQGYTVHYYPSYPVTATSVEILPATAYTNITPYIQTLGVMVVDNATGCKSYTILDIRVLPIPVPLTNPPALPAQCATTYIGSNMPVAIFDLTQNQSYIRNGDNTLSLHYFQTQADADTYQNELLSPTAALVSGNVWIRVENDFTDSNGHKCYVLVEQPLTVSPTPNPVITTNGTGNTIYVDYGNLSIIQEIALDSQITGGNYSYQWYVDGTPIAGAQLSTYQVPLSLTGDPRNYSVVVTNNDTGCPATSSDFEVFQSTLPAPFGNTTQTFTLGQTLADLVVTGSNIQWYATATNKNANTNATPLPLNTLLADATTYYASQTVNGYESPRLGVTAQLALSNTQFNFNDLKYSPNPIVDFLNIKSNEIIKTATIYNMLGQIVATQKCNSLDLKLDFSGLVAGNYFVKLESDTKQKTVKVNKK